MTLDPLCRLLGGDLLSQQQALILCTCDEVGEEIVDQEESYEEECHPGDEAPQIARYSPLRKYLTEEVALLPATFAAALRRSIPSLIV